MTTYFHPTSTNRTLSIHRRSGQDAYEIQLVEIVDKGRGEYERWVLTNHGWVKFSDDLNDNDLPDDLPLIRGFDLSYLPKRKRHRFSRFARLLP